MQIYICQIYFYKQYCIFLNPKAWTFLSLGDTPAAFKWSIFDM